MLSRPLSDRILKCADTVPFVTSTHQSGVRHRAFRLSYKQYDPVKLSKAYEDVVSGNLSLRRAALEYGVPLSTLSDRVTGKVPFGKKSGPPQYLTETEELELENFVVKMAALGFGYGRKEIIQLVQEFLARKNPECKRAVTYGWWESFRKRHPNIVLRQPEPLSRARYISAQSEVLERYFEELECTLVDNSIIDQPSQIFNMDESGFPLDPKSPFVASKKGERHPAFVTSGDKAQITVLACCNAAGYSIPPLIIFDRKTLKQELTYNEVPGTMYGLSKSGWIDSEIFDGWFQNHFLPHAPAARPLLLLLDGHSSHFNPTTIKRAAEEKVIIFCLPPNTTHKTQPLDKGCFSPLKAFWKEECHTYLRNNPGKVITKFQFNQLFSRAWMKGMTMANIIGGFKTTGIFPFNPKALIPEESAPTTFDPSSLCQRTGIKYIPLYSPLPKFQRSQQRSHTADTTFSEEEVCRYQRRYEEGYDIPDERYELWLKSSFTHPRESTPANDHPSFDSTLQLSYISSMSSLLSHKVPEIKIPEVRPNTSGKVLTSAQNLEKLEERKRKKEEETLLKEQKKRERQHKQQQKLKEKAATAIEKQQKQQGKAQQKTSIYQN